MLKPFVAVLGVAACVSAFGQDEKSAKKEATPQSEEKAAAPPKPITLADILDAGRKVVVATYQDFSKIERPDGVFVPGADAARLKAIQGDRPAAGGVTRIEITGDVADAWATMLVVIEARIDDPLGGDLILGLHEAQCSKAELKYHNPAWDASEFVPVEPAPLKKEDVASPYVLRLEKPGSYQLRLTMDVEIERGPVDRQLTLTLPKAPVKSVRLRETAVRPGLRIEGARRSRTDRDVALDPEGKTFIPRLLPDESLDLRWRLVADAAGKNAEASYSLVARSGVRGRHLETTTELAVASRRERRDWVVRLPEGETPGNVQVLLEGKALVATMESLKAETGETRVRIQTSEGVTGAVKILLRSSHPLPTLPPSPDVAIIELTPATLEGAEARDVFALVSVRGDEEVRVTPAPRPEQGVESVPLDRVESEVQAGPRSAAFQFVRADGKLPLRLERLKAVLALSAPPTVALHFEPTAVRLNADFRLSVKQGRFESVRVAMPASAFDVRATADGIACSAVPGEETAEGIRQWTFAFGERRAGEALLHVSASIPSGGKPERIAMPNLPDVQETTTAVSLTKAPGVQVVLSPDELKEFQFLPTGPRSANSAWLSLQSRTRGAVLAATTNRLQGRSTAAVEHRLSASELKLHVSTLMRWENRIEPLNEVRLVIPEGVTEAVIKGERLAAPPGGLAVGPGRTKLPMAAPSESCTALVTYSVPLQKDAASTIPLATPEADNVASCLAELRAPAGRRPLLPPSWEATSAERHVGELLEPDNPFVGLLVRADKAAASLEWRSEPAGSLAEIVVPRMMIVEEMTAAGRRRGRLLAVLSQRRTPFCEILLPPGCTVAETFLDGKPAAVVSSARGDRPSLGLRLPTEERPVALEIRYEAVCKSLSAMRMLSLDVPKLGGDVVVDQVLWRIASPKDALLLDFAEDVISPPPNLWRFDKRLPGEWAFAADENETGAPSMAWINQSFPGLEWAAEPSSFLQGRRWSFLAWGNTGTIRLGAVKEPFWILGASFLTLAAAAGVLGAKRKWRPWVAGSIALVVGLVWLLSPRAMAWYWIGGRWAAIALTVALAAWSIRMLLDHRRRQRLAKRGYTLVEKRAATKTLTLTNSPSSFKRNREAATEIRG